MVRPIGLIHSSYLYALFSAFLLPPDPWKHLAAVLALAPGDEVTKMTKEKGTGK
jgi:hypothetical protein